MEALEDSRRFNYLSILGTTNCFFLTRAQSLPLNSDKRVCHVTMTLVVRVKLFLATKTYYSLFGNCEKLNSFPKNKYPVALLMRLLSMHRFFLEYKRDNRSGCAGYNGGETYITGTIWVESKLLNLVKSFKKQSNCHFFTVHFSNRHQFLDWLHHLSG